MFSSIPNSIWFWPFSSSFALLFEFCCWIYSDICLSFSWHSLYCSSNCFSSSLSFLYKILYSFIWFSSLLFVEEIFSFSFLSIVFFISRSFLIFVFKDKNEEGNLLLLESFIESNKFFFCPFNLSITVSLYLFWFL